MKEGNEFDLESKLCAMIVGDPGLGKTSLALAFPGVYILDCDDNLRPAARFTKTTNFKYDVVNYDDDDEVLPAKRYQRMVDCTNAAAADPDVKTIVIDTLGTFCDNVFSEVKRQQKRADNMPMRIQDWGDFAYLVRNFFIRLKSSGKNVLVNSHNSRETDEATKIMHTFIGIQGQNKDKLSGLFSDVWLLFAAQTGLGGNTKNIRKVRTVPVNANDHRGAKSSIGLPAELTLDELIKLIPTFAK
tara:strand:+ start:5519 stop:6250 length:732 start_codon:yes stop_codon:yes gene_type:complete